MNEWISVNDRVPEGGQLVLIYTPNEEFLTIRIGLFNDWANIKYHLGITHWMPLPEPPKC
jgi:uncharacterized protein DUF551